MTYSEKKESQKSKRRYEHFHPETFYLKITSDHLWLSDGIHFQLPPHFEKKIRNLNYWGFYKSTPYSDSCGYPVYYYKWLDPSTRLPIFRIDMSKNIWDNFKRNDTPTIYGMLALDGRHPSGYLCGYDKVRFNKEISPTMYPMRDQNMSNMKDKENNPIKVNQSHENYPIKVNQSQIPQIFQMKPHHGYVGEKNSFYIMGSNLNVDYLDQFFLKDETVKIPLNQDKKGKDWIKLSTGIVKTPCVVKLHYKINNIEYNYSGESYEFKNKKHNPVGLTSTEIIYPSDTHGENLDLFDDILYYELNNDV